jgi:hypothetical protein
LLRLRYALGSADKTDMYLSFGVPLGAEIDKFIVTSIPAPEWTRII